MRVLPFEVGRAVAVGGELRDRQRVGVEGPPPGQGTAAGRPGQLFNQVIGGRHYLTQEEFSNRDFAINGGGCLQSE